MDFCVDGKYSAFEEVMHYYRWDFYVYYTLLAGVFSNISSEYSVIWGKKIFLLFIVTFILFIFQMIFTLKFKNIEKYERG